jgi:outer membrane protein assembly factor BamB
VEGDVLYCGAGEEVYAIDLVRKEVQWSVRLEEEAEVWAKPVVHDGRVFVEAGTHIFALAAATGEKLWAYETTSYAGGNFYHPVAVSGGRVLAGSPTKNILAVDEDDGEERWSKPGAEGTWNDRLVVEPYVHAGRVAFAFDAIITLEETTEGPDSENVGRAVGLSARNGRVKWTYDAPSFGDVAFADGNVYLASGNDVHVVNIKSGRGTAVPIPGEYTAGLTAAADAVYFVVDGRYLVCGDFSP